MRRLLDILACPICHAALQRFGDELVCVQEAHRFPIVNDVPILFPDGRSLEIQHDAPLTIRTGYDPWLHRNVLQSLTCDNIVLDIGAGNMTLDDPCIIRMDVTLTPYVDVVADAHALPFRNESLDYIMSLAVLEHLRQPFLASQEMYRTLKPGGYVYCDTNFIFAYHGYPHHYFNSTLHGLEQVFSAFTKLRSGVPPYQMPSYAVENVLSVYLQHFIPANAHEIKFIQSVQSVLSYPLRAYDAKFAQDIAYRISAGVFYLGIKRTGVYDILIPKPILDIYYQDDVLQKRYPKVYDLTSLDNLMTWARREGRLIFPDINRSLDTPCSFRKYWDERPLSRPWIESLPFNDPLHIPPTEVDQAEVVGTTSPNGISNSKALPPTAWWQLPGRALTIMHDSGPWAMVGEMQRYLRWLLLRIRQKGQQF